MRKFNYASVILLMILSGIISGVFEKIYDGNLSIIGIIFTWIINYIICRGLLYNREGSFSEYFRGIKTITGKVFLMNILVGAISALGLIFSTITSGTAAVLTDSGMRSFIFISILYMLVTAFFSIIFAYLNFVMADERYRGLPFFTSLKLILKAGFKFFNCGTCYDNSCKVYARVFNNLRYCHNGCIISSCYYGTKLYCKAL